MNYSIYKLHFSTPIHFGKNSLDDSEYTISSDTLFSAMCIEAVGDSYECLTQFFEQADQGKLSLSDLFPYIENKIFLPKPYLFIEHKDNDDSSVIRKAYKKLKYISTDSFSDYLNGSFDINTADDMSKLGKESVKVAASIRNEKGETMPYEVGTFSFNESCGTYFLAGFEDQESEILFDNLMDSLTHSGIGGKRSSGYGRFTYEKEVPNEWLISKLNTKGDQNMLLNTALPKESELDEAVREATYTLVKRSGFVASSSYSDSWQRKHDLFMFSSGSCFKNTFDGDIYDVSTKAGSHPVYRYGKPMFLRLDL